MGVAIVAFLVFLELNQEAGFMAGSTTMDSYSVNKDEVMQQLIFSKTS